MRTTPPLAVIVALLALNPSLSDAEENATKVTPIQLKVMQTRKFAKPPEEVIKAIKTYCQDIGASGAVGVPPMFRDGSIIAGTGTVTCFFTPKFTHSFFGGLKNSVKIAQIKIEPESVAVDSITVRARMYSGYPKGEQITSPEDYNQLFKAIADSIFTEAIKLEAPTQE